MIFLFARQKQKYYLLLEAAVTIKVSQLRERYQREKTRLVSDKKYNHVNLIFMEAEIKKKKAKLVILYNKYNIT